MGIFRTSNWRHLSSSEKIAPRETGRKSGCIQVCNKTWTESESLSRYQVKELPISVYEASWDIWAFQHCIHPFHMPQLSEANPLSLSTLRSGRWLLLAFFLLASNHHGVGGWYIHWISSLGSLHIWRARNYRMAVISCLVVLGRRYFHFTFVENRERTPSTPLTHTATWRKINWNQMVRRDSIDQPHRIGANGTTWTYLSRDPILK